MSYLQLGVLSPTLPPTGIVLPSPVTAAPTTAATPVSTPIGVAIPAGATPPILPVTPTSVATVAPPVVALPVPAPAPVVADDTIMGIQSGKFLAGAAVATLFGLYLIMGKK